MPILLKLNANYGDEFDCEELAIVFNATADQVEAALKQACTTVEEYDEETDKVTRVISDKDTEMYFGTNEFLDANEVLSCTSIKEITDEQAHTMLSLLGIGIEYQFDNSKYPFFTFGTGVLSQIQDHLYTDEE